jgi:hypothetical protein
MATQLTFQGPPPQHYSNTSTPRYDDAKVIS